MTLHHLLPGCLSACVLISLCALTCDPAQGQASETHHGQLSADDPIFGERHYDQYAFTTEPGQVLKVDMISRNLSTRLVLISPSNVLYRPESVYQNTHLARFEMLDLVGGQWTIVATSALIQTGGYTLQIRATPQSIGKPAIFKAGKLDNTASSVDGIHLVERYTAPVTAGHRLLVDLTARRFDTHLVVTLPDGTVLENDDLVPGTINHSRVTGLIATDGTLTVEVRSTDAEGTGRFIVQAWTQPITTTPPPPPAPGRTPAAPGAAGVPATPASAP